MESLTKLCEKLFTSRRERYEERKFREAQKSVLSSMEVQLDRVKTIVVVTAVDSRTCRRSVGSRLVMIFQQVEVVVKEGTGVNVFDLLDYLIAKHDNVLVEKRR